MVVTTWALSTMVAVVTAKWMFDHTRTVMPVVTILNYAIVIPAAGAITYWLSPNQQCTALGGAVSAMAWIGFIWIFVLLIIPLRRYFIADRLFAVGKTISERWLYSTFAAWWILKASLIGSYGIDSLKATQALDQTTPLPYWESVADITVNGLVVGAFAAVLLRLASREIRWRTAALGGLTVLAMMVTGDATFGARREIFAMLILYFVARIAVVGVLRCRKEIIVASAVGIAIFVYYPFIRFNIYDPTLIARLSSGKAGEAAAAMVSLFTPSPDAVADGDTQVLREGVAQLECRLTERQMSAGRLSWGAVSGDALYIALPAFLAPNKLDRDPDLRLAQEQDLYPNHPYLNLDLPANPLLQLQSDFGPLALPLAAGLQALALFVGALFFKQGASAITKLLALALMWSALMSTEATLTQVLTSLRDLILLGLVAESLAWVYRKIRVVTAFQGSSPDTVAVKPRGHI